MADFTVTLKAAERGDPEAQFQLGLMYAEGKGVAGDPAEASAWFKKAAESGHSEAQCYLGLMHYLGFGIARDRIKARAWYRKSAEQDKAEAQLDLAIMLAKGEGGPRDFVQAFKWAALSARQGMKKAAKLRDAIATELTPRQLGEAKLRIVHFQMDRLLATNSEDIEATEGDRSLSKRY